MKIPFTVEQFFAVFTRYNESVWPMQIVLIILALSVIILLFGPHLYSSRLIAAVLSFFWAWMSIAYHFVFFTVINPAAWVFGAFFLAGALWFAWIGVIGNKLRFSLHGGIRTWLGGLLIAFALVIYPMIGFLYGHRYPAMPTFGLPCPTTIFTLGILMFAEMPIPRSAFIVPMLWSIIGSFGAFQLRVPQDYGLLISGLIGLIVTIVPQRTADKGLHTDAAQVDRRKTS